MKSDRISNKTLEGIKDGFYALDCEWRFIYINHLAANNLSREPEELIGKVIWEECHDAIDSSLETIYRKTMRFRVAQCIEMKGNLTGSWYNITTFPAAEGISVYWKDITEQKRAEDIKTEEELRKSEDKYRALFNSIEQGVNIIELVFDDNGKPVDYQCLEANPMQERLTGLRDIIGKRIREIFPNLEDHWLEIYGQVALTGKPARFESWSEDLSCRFDVCAARIGGEGSRTVALVFDNITDRKKAEEMLHEGKERAKSKTVHALVNQVTGSMAKYTFEQMIGSSLLFKEVIRQGKLAALTNYNVLITGESGTGKELIAQSIHNASSRSHMPFVAINCGALPRGLVESELFGYDGGSFTGSKKAGNPGKFELADGGTIFLDEIGDMPLDVQVSLLRVIQEKEVTRIGGSKPKSIDIRVIAATNKNLDEEVLNKTFRQDLYYRLNVLTINMPCLRKRKEDLVPLINNILERIKRQTNKPDLTIDDQAMSLLKNYDWPGNVRELENVLERAANIGADFEINYTDLPLKFSREGKIPSPEIAFIKRTEIDLIMNTLRENHGNIKKTAEILGLSRNTIYNKMKRYNIPRNFGKII